jgi:hypothetical protein
MTIQRLTTSAPVLDLGLVFGAAGARRQHHRAVLFGQVVGPG